jgi:hypothetical protein
LCTTPVGGAEHFLDPTTGVAVVFGSQLCLPGDPEKKLWAEFEEVGELRGYSKESVGLIASRHFIPPEPTVSL